jgi:hypothetical protein
VIRRLGSTSEKGLQESINAICTMISWRYELTLEKRGTASCLGLPKLETLGGKRSRRVSIGKKLDLVSAVAECVGMHTPSAMLTAASVLDKRRGLTSTTGTTKDNKACLRNQSYQYAATHLDEWAPLKHVGFASDAGRVSGKDRQLTAFYSSEAQLSTWAAPVVTSLHHESHERYGFSMMQRRVLPVGVGGRGRAFGGVGVCGGRREGPPTAEEGCLSYGRKGMPPTDRDVPENGRFRCLPGAFLGPKGIPHCRIFWGPDLAGLNVPQNGGCIGLLS